MHLMIIHQFTLCGNHPSGQAARCSFSRHCPMIIYQCIVAGDNQPLQFEDLSTVHILIITHKCTLWLSVTIAQSDDQLQVHTVTVHLTVMCSESTLITSVHLLISVLSVAYTNHLPSLSLIILPVCHWSSSQSVTDHPPRLLLIFLPVWHWFFCQSVTDNPPVCHWFSSQSFTDNPPSLSLIIQPICHCSSSQSVTDHPASLSLTCIFYLNVSSCRCNS